MNLRRLFTLLTAAFFALRAILSARAEEATDEGMRQMKQLVRSRFPEVKQILTADLAAWLADTNRVQPLLLDVRTRAEFKVSHIAGAWQTDPRASASEVVATLPKERPVVVYCSVGYRSSDCATRLLKAGFTNVVNLEGSIFQWANEGRPLMSDGKPAAVVHPYNETFGKLLKPELRAEQWKEPE